MYAHVPKKTPTYVFFIFLWKMIRFSQNFQEMFRRKHVFNWVKVKYFFATGDVLLTSYICVCKFWISPLKTDI